MSLSTGDVIEGKYRIVRLIGEGGMGAVYEGENVRIHRKVAIKVLHAGVAENADAVQRFEREAQAAGRIGSEHIVEVLDLGNLPSGDRFMVMEFLDGMPLSDRIRANGRLTPQQLYPIARAILEGLAAAHGAGIVHRDLKPDNVYLLRSRGGTVDFVKLLDFGISKFSALSGESGFSMTRTGAVMGTPYYMSPEQAKGAKNMDHRADLYAVGVIFYEALTGQVPFNADTFNELLFKIVLETPPPIEQIVVDSDPHFNQIVQKLMARDPGVRFQTAREVQEALDAWANGTGVMAVPTALNVTPGARPPQPGIALSGATPTGGMPHPAGALTPSKGTPGAWANTGSGPKPAEPSVSPSKSNTVVFAGIAAALLLLAGGGVAALSLFKEEPPPAPPPQPAGPSLDDIRAAAAEEAKRVASMAQKEAEEEIRKAEARAREAEERAKQASESMRKQAEEEAEKEKVRLKSLQAAVASKKPASKPPTESKPAPTATSNPQPAATSTGRKIRTEL